MKRSLLSRRASTGAAPGRRARKTSTSSVPEPPKALLPVAPDGKEPLVFNAQKVLVRDAPLLLRAAAGVGLYRVDAAEPAPLADGVGTAAEEPGHLSRRVELLYNALRRCEFPNDCDGLFYGLKPPLKATEGLKHGSGWRDRTGSARYLSDRFVA